ncbi:hypothetical protein PSN45_002472 [Yamadazyma tenuis]|uniref:Mitochondrial glycine transporter n=1 Tax=Candida tenuis (strain ATCC 10573 / BCRC 21748 / CBS 615 / JCM 9827 / NBRC 10315 / NRRL Y-1498 / VKM Y-70) TaxID=590646 RepID=G3B0C8_CANTC|nr:mitochondrial carrier [Yamadazyma tenuis ATCC 10573]XP_006685216.1 uncharacterized protein CANTEDRAFT_113093 [Yamadazyma tenuis ATCC 10573]EGV65529.1 mitochondrial carrier [Yamadazyma tenuis ATCC 10573]EGV65530.1 hypothetical protein CANTEDRAFT_113093 [Yamadazyma tenuis ATCC 10573]WEJ94968.1 hypothetical protein PSN45_002472 [Yamadazyma tenuis]
MANELSSKKSLAAGGLAGLTSSVMLQPFDLLKTRLQQQKQHNLNYNTTLVKEIRKLKNFKELWRGVLPSCLRTSMGSAIYLTLLLKSRFYLSSFKIDSTVLPSSSILPKLSHLQNLSVGFVVRAIAGYITMPITIIKTRYESNIYSYNSMYESVEGIYFDGKNSPGTIRNFFKGSLVTLSRDCPYAGLYVLFYEWFKTDLYRIASRSHQDHLKGGVTNSASAVLAASLATTITAPFDAIKTRMQLSSTHASISQTMKILVSEPGGMRNLFKGLSLRLSRKGLSAGISWCIYEELLKRL